MAVLLLVPEISIVSLVEIDHPFTYFGAALCEILLENPESVKKVTSAETVARRLQAFQ